MAFFKVSASQGLDRYWCAGRTDIRIPRQDDADDFRITPLDDGQKLSAVHPRHAHIRNHHVKRLPAQDFQGLQAAGGKRRLPVPPHAAQHPPHAFQDLGFVIHKQDL